MDQGTQTSDVGENPTCCYSHRPFFFFPFAMMVFILVPVFFISRPFFFYRFSWLFWVLIIFIPLWIILMSTGRERRRDRHYRRYYSQYVPVNDIPVSVNTVSTQKTNSILFCSNCGSRAGSNDRFCSSCGFRLE